MASCLSASRKKAGRQEGREEVGRRQRIARQPFPEEREKRCENLSLGEKSSSFRQSSSQPERRLTNIRKETFSCCLGLLRKFFVYSGYPVYTGYGVQVEEGEKDHHCHSFPFSLYVCLE